MNETQNLKLSKPFVTEKYDISVFNKNFETIDTAVKTLLDKTNPSTTTNSGIVQLTDSIESTSMTTAATPNSVRQVYEETKKKVDKVNGKTLTSNDLTDDLKETYDSAFKHSIASHARVDATRIESSSVNGHIKIDDVETTVYSHPDSHSAAMIKTDKEKQFVSEVEKNNYLDKYSKSEIDEIHGNSDISSIGDGTITGAIKQINSISKGKNQSLVYPTYKAMVEEFNTLEADVLTVGQNIYIGAVGIPDLWVYAAFATSVTYAYITDDDMVDKIQSDTYLQIGHYSVAFLETQKVDLSDIDNNISALSSELKSLQSPTFTEVSSLVALQSGEVFTTAFGKIAKSISSLISHIADTTKHITSEERTTWNKPQYSVIKKGAYSVDDGVGLFLPANQWTYTGLTFTTSNINLILDVAVYFNWRTSSMQDVLVGIKYGDSPYRYIQHTSCQLYQHSWVNFTNFTTSGATFSIYINPPQDGRVMYLNCVAKYTNSFQVV